MHRDVVPPCTYVVSQRKNEILEAYLGSCVGVTLCDRGADLGAFIHLLLPEPTGADIAYRPETYATTGMPLVIRSLLERGASKDRLEACVAGGALMGAVGGQDQVLDIGLRTTEIVQDILRGEGIPIAQAETGGYSGCKLCLNLATWESGIEPVWQPPDSGEETFHRPSLDEVAMAVDRVQPIPQILLKVIRMIQSEEYNMEDIAAEVQQDQVISAGVLKLCNTALMGLTKKVDSIDRALIALGEKKLLQLVVSASLNPIFPKYRLGYSLCKGGIFQHALGTAMIAHELAVYTKKSVPDVAYTAGLLHDIGKIPLDQYMSSGLHSFYRSNPQEGGGLCELERKAFGISHTEAGELLAQKWSLPENLAEVIKSHHQPESATIDPTLTTLVYMADLLMARFQVAHEIDFITPEELESKLAVMGLGPENFPVLIDRIPRAVFETSLTGI